MDTCHTSHHAFSWFYEVSWARRSGSNKTQKKVPQTVYWQRSISGSCFFGTLNPALGCWYESEDLNQSQFWGVPSKSPSIGIKCSWFLLIFWSCKGMLFTKHMGNQPITNFIAWFPFFVLHHLLSSFAFAKAASPAFHAVALVGAWRCRLQDFFSWGASGFLVVYLLFSWQLQKKTPKKCS